MGSILFLRPRKMRAAADTVDRPQIMHQLGIGLLLACLTAALSACAPDINKDNSSLDAHGESRRPIALFDLQNQQKLPWPNAVVQTKLDESGNLVVGPLNLPNPDNNPLLDQVNKLSGFTQLPVITIDFSKAISEASVQVGKNLIIAGVDPTGQQEMDALKPEEVSVSFDKTYNKLRIYPLRPLRPAHQYVVVLTKSIKGVDGNPIQEDLFFRFTKYKQPLYDPATKRVQSDLLALSGVGPQEAAQLEQLRQIYQQNIYGNPALNAAVAGELKGTPTPKQILDNYAVATAFITASYAGGSPTAELGNLVDHVLDSDAGKVVPNSTSVIPAALFFNPANPAAPAVPHANIELVAFTHITTEDYRNQAGFWPSGVDETGTATAATAQVLAIYPSAITQGPVPVVIFQHGLGSCKNQAMFAVADSFASAGFAIVGIDAIEHGTRALTNVDPSNDQGDLGPCDQQAVNGGVARSGEGFIRLDNLAITRDAIRQTVLDQVALLKAVNTAGVFALSQNGSTDFAPGSATYAGVSLGAILGSILLAEQDAMNLGVLNVPGAWLSRLFTESQTFGPQLLGTLSAQMNMGPVTGETFQDFLTKLVPLVQGLIDPADPAYYMYAAKNGDRIAESKSILIQEVIGDTVIPNASTAYMAQVGGIPLVKESKDEPHPHSAYTQFKDAAHSTFLTPDNPAKDGQDQDFLPATTAMRTQALTFIGSFLQSSGNVVKVQISE